MYNDHLTAIEKYVRAANYLAVAQVYLQDNFLLDRPLTFDDIKTALIGHWGTCPGINFIYAHLNYLITQQKKSVLFILGPGHGYPALQANLFLEGTLCKYYPEATRDAAGVAYVCKNFGWPYGFPSHTNPGTPGAILEGGELGYALATAYGAILDNPNLITACMIGDGEAETGATATAWHLSKFIDPITCGAVLPILHLNGYKMSGPSIFGRMSNKELRSLFYGYGYQPIIIEGRDIYAKAADGLQYAFNIIEDIQQQFRSGKAEGAARFPMIILKTKKGWTGPKYFNGNKYEDNNLSHQVIFGNAKSDKRELRALEKWLRSYKFNEIFDAQKGLHHDVTKIIPTQELCMGNNNHAYSGREYKKLILPDSSRFVKEIVCQATADCSCMRRAGMYLRDVCNLNASQNNFRFMSPDEIYSNKLDALLSCTSRAFELPKKKWDRSLASDGRVIEMLSEHSLQGLAQGYTLTGRHAVFASYEAFIDVVGSMAAQYAKFLKVAPEYPWRGDCASLNYILTSLGWRQEHNGFSHQNPGFVDDMLKKCCSFIRAYFPADSNSMLVVLEHCLASKNGINIIVAGKTCEPDWLSFSDAKKALEHGLMIWDFASDQNPDIVFAAVGDYLTKEALAAIDLLKAVVTHVKIRFVNIVVLSSGGSFGYDELTTEAFNSYFTADKPVIFNYHGYTEILKASLFNRYNTERFTVNGYLENGSTTTPFDMQVLNGTSRYHLVIQALERLAHSGVIDVNTKNRLTDYYQEKLRECKAYIKKYGADPQEIKEWQWK